MVRISIGLLAVAVALAAGPRGDHPAEVSLLSPPSGGIQPQAAVDAQGTLHLLYFTGDPAAGDLYYVRRSSGGKAFSPPIRVNSEPGSATATGSVRGGHLALGRNGWVHVAWDARPIRDNQTTYTPMYYTRLARSASAFEPQRAIGRTVSLDGGTIAADPRGHVYLVWHARGAIEGEAHRAVYFASSDDDGVHFASERALVDEGGVCGCCALTALADRDGRLNVLYRAATDAVHRDATWIVADGTSHRGERLGAWDLNACPMTTFALAQAPEGLIAAWQTERQLFVTTLDPTRVKHSTVEPLSGAGVRAHPSIAVNGSGERLIAWTDGTGWARGGTLSWELQSGRGEREDGRERVAAVPVWGLVSAVALPDGSFIVVH